MAYNDVGGYDKVRDTINKWTVQPVNKNQVDPVALAYSTSGYAVEQFQWNTYHTLIDMTDNDEIKGVFSELALWEEYHQSLMGSLIDPDTTLQERSLALEMTAVLGFSDAAQLEIEEDAKVAYDYMLMDHLTHAKTVIDTASGEGMNPADIIKGQFKIQEGRPLEKQIVPSADLLKEPLDKNTAEVTSFVYLHTLLANEQQLRNLFQIIRTMLPSTEARQLYNMMSVIENFHTTMLDSLNDPTITPLEYAMINELMEIRTHRLGVQMAETESARAAHEASMHGDQYHLSLLQDAYAKFEQGDPSRFAITDALFMLPPVFADAYIDQVMQTQLNLSPRGTGFEMAA
jgi:rubrerythrin